jgi:hypothetical protein
MANVAGYLNELQNCSGKGQRVPGPVRGPEILRHLRPGAYEAQNGDNRCSSSPQLAVTPWFERETGSCCVGKETKQVIYASNAPQVPMGNRSMAIMPQPVRPVQDQNGS